MLVRRYQRKLAARGQKLELVILDYLQLLKSANKRAKIYEEVSDVSRMLKKVALSCDVAVLALAQLSRQVEQREDKRPVLSDLRDSGQIEQDADAVVFLYREEYYLQQSEPERGHPKREAWELSMQRASERVDVFSAKVRDGALARRQCYFFAERQAMRGSRYFETRGQGI
jgi:replicative DNA helicase